MVGGTYLAFEGAEKVYELVSGHAKEKTTQPAAALGKDTENTMVAGAIRTDFILSAEIMVIALNEVADEPLLSRAMILVVVALGITVLVYGIVALIVKMDDIGLRLARTRHGALAATGRLLVRAMPKVLSVLSAVGIVAMLWVGGHILLVGVDDLGWHPLYDLVHRAEEAVHTVPRIGGSLAWLTNTLASALIGLLVGSLAVAITHQFQRHQGTDVAHRRREPRHPTKGPSDE